MSQENEDIDIIDALNNAGKPVDADIKINKEEVDNLLNGTPEFEDDDEEEIKDIPHEEIKDKSTTEQPKATVEEKAKFQRSAERYVKAFNSLLKIVLPSWYRSKIMVKGDWEAIKEVKKKKDLNPRFNIEEAITNDSKLYAAMKRFEKLEEYINDAPLTKEEQKDISDSLSEVIEKYRWMQVGPEGALIISVGLVMLPRLEPLFPNLSGFFTRIFKKDE